MRANVHPPIALRRVSRLPCLLAVGAALLVSGCASGGGVSDPYPAAKSPQSGDAYPDWTKALSLPLMPWMGQGMSQSF